MALESHPILLKNAGDTIKAVPIRLSLYSGDQGWLSRLTWGYGQEAGGPGKVLNTTLHRLPTGSLKTLHKLYEEILILQVQKLSTGEGK